MTEEEITRQLSEMDKEQDRFWRERQGKLSTENMLQLKALVRKQIRERGLPVKPVFSVSHDRKQIQIEYHIEEPSAND